MPRAVIWCAVSTAAQAMEDKTSLDTQESDGRAAAEREGLTVIEVLRVPGHSRRYLSLEKCAEDMLNAGIVAFSRLIELWESRGFDVLIVRDGDRFARTQSLHLRVVEETIQAGARIFSLADGWIGPDNYRLWGVLNSYKAASEIDQLQKRRGASLRARVASGLPWSYPTFPFIVERDLRSGKAIRMIIDESSRALLDDLARLVLQGVAWDKIAPRLAELGYTHSPLTHDPYRFFYAPMTWGHMAVRNRHLGSWAYDESAPLPKGVTIWRDTHQAAYEGEIAQRLMEELNRRQGLRGRAKGDTEYIFSGLLMCDGCRRIMVGTTRQPGGKWTGKTPYSIYRCKSRGLDRRAGREINCNSKPTIRAAVVQAEVSAILEAILAGRVGLLEPVDNSALIPQVRQEIERTEDSIRDLIQRQAAARDSLKGLYDEQINTLGEALEKQRERLRLLQASHPARPKRALDELRKIGVQGLWLMAPYKANQLLKVLMGKARFLVRDGHIVGVSV